MRSLGGFRRLRERENEHEEKTREKKRAQRHCRQTDRQTPRKRYSLPLTCPLCRWVCSDSAVTEALGREHSGLLQSQPPCSGCQSHLGVPLTPPQPSPGSSSSSSSSEPLWHQPQPGCAAGSERSAHIPAHPGASQRIPASPTWQQEPSCSPREPPGTAEHGRRMPKAAGEHLGAGSGGGCLARALALSLCWNKAPARLAASGSPELWCPQIAHLQELPQTGGLGEFH